MNEISHAASVQIDQPLIGRKRERRIAEDALATAQAGQGRLVLISGEAGIGKSALAEHICSAAGGLPVFTGHSYELAETPPYGPWIELFSRYRPTDGESQLPEVFADPGTVGDVTSTGALFREIRAFFAELTLLETGENRPVIILLEDLHWTDPASLDLLRFLAREITDLPILILATYRSDELSPVHLLARLLPAITRESRAIPIDLQRLQYDDIEELVSGRYSLSPTDRRRLVDYVFSRAEGNPFFTIEVIRAREESRVLHPSGNVWHVGDLSRIPVPPLARQVIEDRLARVDRDRRRLLSIAAVIGQEVSLDLWASVAGLERDRLLATIERALTSHLMEEAAGTRLRFVHALIRETIYDATPLLLRQEWHRQVAEELIASSHPDPDAIANHLERAGDERAAEWIIQAGDRAQRAFAWLTAIDRYHAAHDLLEATGDDRAQRTWLLSLLGLLHRYSNPQLGIWYMERAARLAGRTADPVLVALTQFYLGHLLSFAGDGIRGVEQQRVGIAALDALDTADRDRFLTMTADGRMAREFSPWASFAVSLGLFGHYRESEELIHRLVHESADEGERVQLRNAAAYRALAAVHAASGRPQQAREAATLARTMFDRLDHQAMLGNSAMIELHWVVLVYQTDDLAERAKVSAVTERAWSLASNSVSQPDFSPRSGCFALLLLTGEWDEANQIGSMMLRLGWFTDEFIGEIARLARWRGDLELAHEIIDNGMTDGPLTPAGKLHHRSGLELQRVAAALAIDDGDLDGARVWLEAHDRWLDWSETVLGRAEGHLAWARWHRTCGNLEAALEQAGEALQAASNPRQPLALIDAHRVLGELETDLEWFDSARDQLQSSLALADACTAPYERARSLVAFAKMAAAEGDRDTSREHLAAARAICAGLGAKLLLDRIDALEAELARASSDTLPRGITAREIEVIRLAAKGYDNATIAAQLFISVHTVHRHMVNVLTKLDISSRTAAVAWAARHELL